jgi:hypothetical protein
VIRKRLTMLMAAAMFALPLYRVAVLAQFLLPEPVAKRSYTVPPRRVRSTTLVHPAPRVRGIGVGDGGRPKLVQVPRSPSAAVAPVRPSIPCSASPAIACRANFPLRC